MKHYSSLSDADIEKKTFDKLDVTDPRVKEFARLVRAWDNEFPKGLFLYGIPGNAKTHLMKALIIHNCSPSYRFLFISVSDFMVKCKEYVKTYFHAGDYIDSLVKNYNAIVLDDLGSEKASDFEQQELFRLMESMASADKRIFMTSNLTIDELRKKYHERIVSRYGEYMVFIENECESYRKKIHKQSLEMYREKVRILPRNTRK